MSHINQASPEPGIQVGSARVHLSGDGCNHRDSNVCPACAELTDDEVAALREYFERIAVMSDVSAVEVIAGVLRKHGRTPESHPIGGHAPLYRCGCDPLGQPPRWSGTEHAQHVAVEVDKALGGLARERKPVNQKNRAKPCGNCGHLKGVHAEPCVILVRDGLGVHECGCPEHTYTEPVTEWVGRWIGGWTPEEAS